MFSWIPSFFFFHRVSASCQLFDISIQTKIKELFLSSESVCLQLQHKDTHCVKSIRVWSFSGLHFPAFGLNTEICGVNIRIQSKCGKIRTRKLRTKKIFRPSHWSKSNWSQSKYFTETQDCCKQLRLSLK